MWSQGSLPGLLIPTATQLECRTASGGPGSQPCLGGPPPTDVRLGLKVKAHLISPFTAVSLRL